MNNQNSRHSDLIAITTVAALLFAATMYTGVGGRFNFGDSAKWQYLWIVDGTPHSTGYPLFLMLTELFGNSLTFLSAPLRITLISTLFGLVSIAYFHKIAMFLTANRLIAAAGSLLLCTGLTFWIHATEPEVYSLHLAFHLAVTYYLLLAATTGRIKWFYIACFLYALSFGNHLLMITMLPAIVFITASYFPNVFKNPKSLLIIASFIALGASQYYYLWALAQHQSPWLEFIGYKPTFSHFIDYITGGEFRENFHATESPQTLKKLLSTQAGNELNLAILLLIPVSVWLNWRSAQKHDKKLVIFLLLQIAATAGFCLFYAMPDIETYFLSITAGLILLFLLPTATPRYDHIRLCVLVVSVLYGFSHNLPALINFPRGFETQISALRSALPDNARVFSVQGLSVGFYSGQHGHHVWNQARLDNKSITILGDPGSLDTVDSFYFLPEEYELVKNTNQFLIEPMLITTQLSETLTQAPEQNTARILIAYKPEATVINHLKLALNDKKLEALASKHSFVALLTADQPPAIATHKRNSSEISINTGGVELATMSLSARSGSRWRDHDGYYRINGSKTALHCRGLSIVDISLNDAAVKNYFCFTGDRLDSRSVPLPLFKATRLPRQ